MYRIDFTLTLTICVLMVAYCPPSIAGQPRVLTGNTADVDSLGFSNDGKWLVSGSDDGLVRLWQTSTGKQHKQWKAHDNRVSGLTIAPDGKTFLTVSRDCTAKIWDLNTGKLRHTLQGHTERIYRGEFDTDGKTVVTAGRDGIRFWSRETGELLNTVAPVDEEQFSFIDIHPAGAQFATSSRSGPVRIWNRPANKVVTKLAGHSDRTYCLRYFDRGKMLISGGVDSMVRVWDGSESREVWKLSGHDGRVLCVAISPNGPVAASGSEDNNVRLWNLDKGVAEKVLRGHTEPVQAVAFSPDGKLLASGGKDRTIRIWSLETPEQSGSR